MFPSRTPRSSLQMEPVPAPSNASTVRKFRRAQSVQEETIASTSALRKNSRQSSRSRSSRRTSGVSLALLTFSQRQAIQISWRLIRPQASSMFRKIFLELEIACPKVKQIFYKAALVDAFNKDGENSATLDEHVKLAAKFFDDLLAVLDEEEEFRTLIRRMGAVHAVLARTCNFGGEVWERLGEIVMERICGLESCQTREASRSWRTLIACVIDELRTGFEEEHRLVNRRSSSASDLHDELMMEEEAGATKLRGEEIPRCPYSISATTDDLQSKLRELRLQYTSTVPLQ